MMDGLPGLEILFREEFIFQYTDISRYYLNIAAQNANCPEMDFSYLNTETSCINIGGEWEPPLMISV